MSESGGEHWCSVCEVPQLKGKGTYLKLYRKQYQKKMVIKILCPECEEKEKETYAVFGLFRGKKVPASGVESAPAAACTLCNKRIYKKDGSLTIEIREDGEEFRVDVCHRCLDKDGEILEAYDAIHSPNPVFEVDLNCLAVDECESFKKPGRDRGINCGHVCVNIDGELYCRRSHPGKVKIYRERWALPPSRRKLNETLRDLIPFFEKMKENAATAMDFMDKSRESSEAATPIWEPPDNIKYEIIYVPKDEEGRFTVPWGATPLDLMPAQDELRCVIPFKKVNESE